RCQKQDPSQSSSIKQILKPAENAGFLLPKKLHNARLRGWQRITTKLKHNNCNHRGSLGLETPRVDSPS
ncbi:hypothetical protein, partial [Vibrio cholerae]|uniref:hypothetical protein n=1 Tax=Vibrio cholerae TaxID=666 RepID=UPI001E3FD666